MHLVQWHWHKCSAVAPNSSHTCQGYKIEETLDETIPDKFHIPEDWLNEDFNYPSPPESLTFETVCIKADHLSKEERSLVVATSWMGRFRHANISL